MISLTLKLIIIHLMSAYYFITQIYEIVDSHQILDMWAFFNFFQLQALHLIFFFTITVFT